METKKSVFVTVGTTRFDTLIHRICTPEIVRELRRHGFLRVAMQIGNSDVNDIDFESLGREIEVEHFRFKPSIRDEMIGADLIISHAGAGSLFESLGHKKKCVAVVNEELMDNHQIELASELHKRGHIVMTTASNLLSLLQGDSFLDILNALVQLEPPKTSTFARIVDEVMGL